MKTLPAHPNRRIAPLLLLYIIAILASCASSRQAATADRDGSSYESAVIVNSIREEYQWVAEHHPGARIKSQALTKHKGKHYDILTFTMPDGSDKDFYFDINKFFGKGF